MRVVLVSAVVDLISYLWKMLTAVGVVSDATSAYWNARLIFPVAEGCMVLPCALVVSVWMDVANSSMSRSKVTYDMWYRFSQLFTVAFRSERF